ncbi:MAG: AbrB/MazE/SpoVT family DNA-binding domain-containing protein [Verrucomicrobiales bacterium]
MSDTISIDKAGRVVIPKAMREKLHLAPGTSLHAEIVGDRIELTPATAEVRVVREGKRRVLTGGVPFDAAKAVREAREEREAQLAERLGR